VCGWFNSVVEWPCTFCVIIAWLDNGFGMSSDRVMRLNDGSLDSRRHCGCMWVVRGEVFVGKVSIEVAVDAICSNGIIGEVNKVEGLAWQEVHL